jgi:hypothetical protein
MRICKSAIRFSFAPKRPFLEFSDQPQRRGQGSRGCDVEGGFPSLLLVQIAPQGKEDKELESDTGTKDLDLRVGINRLVRRKKRKEKGKRTKLVSSMQGEARYKKKIKNVEKKN